ncbi:MAG: TatD family hydrolase [Clostridiaceae bacterium]
MDYKIFDTHTHYDDDAFNEDREYIINELINNNVIGILNCGASIEGARASVELSKKYSIFYAAVGIHPEYADKVDEGIIEELKELCKNNKVRAIGEIGLDYYYEENPPREVQLKAFRMQMKLAKELNLPVIIHDRDAHQDTLEVIKEFPEVKGEIHCFSGSVEFAKECVKRGYVLGISGVITFKNARKLVEVVKEIPLEYLVVETDCPYMAPVPYRGKRNYSLFIPHIIEKIAEIKCELPINVNKQLISNSHRLLNIDC